ncbi:hypothetical protein [Brevundimonas sp. PAMC22021]|uniref:hypothetical protein n=1 Tax=Brevundimonas sp. PAMC22021 TaxID=2861285 RepID=UPI0021063E99|nr:hypothetical protein [Brevundimonas sp. PAMC22021]
MERPAPLWDRLEAPAVFAEALDAEMNRHGDSAWALHRAIAAKEAVVDLTTIRAWRRGTKVPATPASFRVISLIEQRYCLPEGWLRSRLDPSRVVSGHRPRGVSAAERQRLAWHLPDDFGTRSLSEQDQIVAWVQSSILSGGTAFHRYHAEVSKHRFSIRFEGSVGSVPLRSGKKLSARSEFAPPSRLAQEMANLLRFKTQTLTDIGFQRSGVWNAETASQKIEHLGLMFGALAMPAESVSKGFGLPREKLTFALLVSPAVWDWYVQWREARRGFYTGWEAEMLLLAAALARSGTGWLRQNPRLASELEPVDGLITEDEIRKIVADWDAACERLNRHVLARAREIQRVARVHRDPFEPLLPILEAPRPVAEYLKITEEILRRMPNAERYPKLAAESVRSFLMLRFGLHLGLRQKNLRQLLFRAKGDPATSERELERIKAGELRWSERDNGWEVFIPCAAFKNANSAYFSRRPFRLVLPDLGDLYRWIDDYIANRPLLLAGAADPGVFFVKTVKRTSHDAAYSQQGFYEAWRLTIQRYGIYNPWTGRGAIPGLLPHGPHSVRDVLATHILKQTGSYEQASYAIQDTPATVAAHYGRFLPQDKAALAAQILNQVWENN